jgi:hypothetical protein
VLTRLSTLRSLNLVSYGGRSHHCLDNHSFGYAPYCLAVSMLEAYLHIFGCTLPDCAMHCAHDNKSAGQLPPRAQGLFSAQQPAATAHRHREACDWRWLCRGAGETRTMLVV